MNDFQRMKLGEILVFTNGKKRPSGTGAIPVYGGNGIFDFTNISNFENVIIVGRVGAYCGSIFYEKDKCWVSDNAIAGQSKDKSNILYMYYLLKSLNLNARRIGTSQPLLTQEILNSIDVVIPPIKKQNDIASFLMSLDKKIALNSKINRNLEEQAKAIFKSWQKQCSIQTTIRDIVSNVLDYTPNLNSKVVLINSSDVTKGFFEHHNLSDNQDLKGHFKKRFNKYDVLFSEIRPKNKHYAYVLFDTDQYIASTRLMVLRNKPERISSSLLYQYLTSDEVCEQFTTSTETRSGTFPQGCFEDLARIPIMLNPVEEQKEITPVLDTIYYQIYCNHEENRHLCLLRDTLLPKLMSGEFKNIINTVSPEEE